MFNYKIANNITIFCLSFTIGILSATLLFTENAQKHLTEDVPEIQTQIISQPKNNLESQAPTQITARKPICVSYDLSREKTKELLYKKVEIEIFLTESNDLSKSRKEKLQKQIRKLDEQIKKLNADSGNKAFQIESNQAHNLLYVPDCVKY